LNIVNRGSVFPGKIRNMASGLLFFTLFILLIKTIFFIFLIYFNENAFYTPDSRSYILRALDISNYSTFSLRGEPDIFRTPGYPLLLVPFIFSLPRFTW